MSKTLSNDEFFNRYDIDIREGRLGGGSFGTVYKAYDNERDEIKAVKVSEVRYINNKEFSLQSEFDATKDLPVHKNIANYEAVYQLEMPNGLFDYAIMQYYPDGNLKELVKNNNLTLDSKKHIIDGLIKGLQYLHKNGIIHRDIKPSNILISERKGVYTPKIADFGLSKIVDSGEMEAFTNSFGGGTLEYSSPEQLLGERLRYNADLWAVGIIAYELLTGSMPFSARDVSGSAEAKRKVIYQNIVNAPIPALVESCPAPYNEIIRKCLVKDPKKRVQKAEELLSVLNSAPLLTPDDDEGTIFIEEVESNNTIESKIESKPKGDLPIRKYGKWLAALLLILIAGFGAKTIFNEDTGNQITENVNEITDKKLDGNKSDIEALLAEDPDNQNDAAIIDRMKQLRIEEEKEIWQIASADNSVTTYEEYIALYPDGIYTVEANARIKLLLSGSDFADEESAWKFALKNESITAFKNIISLFPNGKHAKAAQFKINLLERKIEAEQWAKVENSNSLEDLNRYENLFPNGKNIAKAKQRVQVVKKDIEISKAYKSAIKINTIEALETFLSKYPESRYKEEMERKKQILLEEITAKAKSSLRQTNVNISNSEGNSELLENPNESSEGIELDTPDNTEISDTETKGEEEPPIEVPGDDIADKSDNSNEDGETTQSPEPKREIPVISEFIKTLDDNMVILSPTTYSLGCDEGCDDDAMPSKTVTISPIKVSKYEVTQSDYSAVMGANPSLFSDCGDCPVENISFYDAQEYIKRINEMTGNPYKYRLPTEAEWEYAASAGTQYKFAGGDKVESVALYKSNSSRSTGPVNSKKTNKNILYCMSGNVYEWCDSWYSKDGYQSEGEKKYKVIRGGSWNSKSSACAVKTRGKTTPDDKRPIIGMRLVRDI